MKMAELPLLFINAKMRINVRSRVRSVVVM